MRAVDDERAPRPQLSEHLRDRPHERRHVDADHLRPGAGGVRERAEHVEHGTRGQLAPHGRRVPHRRMVRRREHEAEAELVDRLFDAGHRLLERKTKRFEHVRRARCGRDGAVAVLRHACTRSGRNDRRRSRDVDRARAVAAGPSRVDEVVALRPDGEHVAAHRLRTAGDLVRGLALEPERHEEPPDLCLRRLAAHDLVHHFVGLRSRQGASVEQFGEGLLDHVRKFLPRSGPSGVKTLSGWNWTPSIGSSRWRTPITSPSGVRAVTSSTSGTCRAASEW